MAADPWSSPLSDPLQPPLSWRIHLWVLGDRSFTAQVLERGQAVMERPDPQRSPWRDQCSMWSSTPALQLAPFLCAPGVSATVVRANAFPNGGAHLLHPLEKKLRTTPGWQPWFVVVLAAWACDPLPLDVNLLDATPTARVMTVTPLNVIGP